MADSKGKPPIEEIISALKNLLTTSGITFIFVAGKDAHDRLLKDIRRGESIYESVFAFDKYLPALWSGSKDIFTRLISEPEHERIEAFIKYLDFEGRGIPRKMRRTFNRYIRSEKDIHYLEFNPAESRRIHLYAELKNILSQEDPKNRPANRSDEQRGIWDKQQLCLYYLTDWILQRGNHPFTNDDVKRVALGLTASIAPNPEAAERLVGYLLKLLGKHGYINQVYDQTIYGIEQTIAPQYVVPRHRLIELGLVDGQNNVDFSESVIGEKEKQFGHYQLLEFIASGGLTDVYRAWDAVAQDEVAIKIIKRPYMEYAQHLATEGEMLSKLSHPNLVKYHHHKTVKYGDVKEYPYVVLGYVDGISLADTIPSKGFLRHDKALAIFLPIAEVVEYLHSKNIIRCDIKPANIMLTDNGEVILVDLGTATYEDKVTKEKLIGTPLYMAPEQINREGVDRRSDIYSLGLCLFELITGRSPFKGFTNDEILSLRRDNPYQDIVRLQNLREEIIPKKLKNIIAKCVERDPNNRFKDTSELLAALSEYSVTGATEIIKEIVKEKRIVLDNKENFATEELPLQKNNSQTLHQIPDPKIPDYKLPKAKKEEMLLRPYLEINIPGLDPKRSPIKELEKYLIGRSQENDLKLDSYLISRHHAVIRQDGGKFIVEDLNSLNGTNVITILDGKRVSKTVRKHLLLDGDIISIQDVTIQFNGEVS